MIQESARLIRVRGLVQGVGFRPTVWRLARRLELRGWVANDGQGVSIHVCGAAAAVEKFLLDLPREAPPLARIDSIEQEAAPALPPQVRFEFAVSRADEVHTAIVPDAATCPACLAEVLEPSSRRHRYPFANCTHCGPRLSILEAIPYDRAATTMREFSLCAACAAEYADPGDRRFHAQPVACPACGPRIWLESGDGTRVAEGASSAVDALDAACTLLARGHVLAIKGLGGFQLACDACNETVVARLRRLKRRAAKPFALMVRDLEVLRRYCIVTADEEALLRSPAGPIVILSARAAGHIAASVAPGVATLGVMLPTTPLHHLLMQRLDRPLVLTSGNLSDEPQCIANAQARERLGGIAEYLVMHDRGIARRVDDSVVRVMAGAARVLRRARGYAPAPITLPHGFESVPAVLAMGGELKNTFCLLRDGQAVMSHHIGDLQEARTHEDYREAVGRYLELFEHEPQLLAVDLHPEYLSGKLGRTLATRRALPVAQVQHHHAHIAACLAENGVALDAAPVLGVALDGLGRGDDGELWGGEFLLTDYYECRRLATFRPIAMPGGERAVHEPWRNTYAHLSATLGWERFARRYPQLELYRFLDARPRRLLDEMIARGVNSPLASSCGRLFDAVAAALGVCRERAHYEGQAAVELEAAVDERALREEDDARAYPLGIVRLNDLPCLDPLPMWEALLDDLAANTSVPLIAARFHKGLAIAVARMAEQLRRSNRGRPIDTIALSGGVFQNRVLLEQLVARLEALDMRVLMHRQVPTSDGGLSLGQAVVAVAHLRARRNRARRPCA